MSSAFSGPADVRVELQEYLKEKNLHATFVSIVEALLIDKPENPIEYMARYLVNKYPNETKNVVKLVSPPSTEDDTSVTDTDSNSDSDESTVPEVRQSFASNSSLGSQRPKIRRNSICPVYICPVEAEAAVVKNIPKTREESERILNSLKKNALLQFFDRDQKQVIHDSMFSVKKGKSDVIIKQGEDGDNFYIIDSGSVNVYVADPVGSAEGGGGGGSSAAAPPSVGKLVATFGAGDSFGELAIMHNAPRSATCIATSPVRLWALDRTTFKTVLVKNAVTKEKLYTGFLRNVPVLSNLTEAEFVKVADALKEERFEGGSVICRQGERGENFYIIKEGSVVCTKMDSDGTTREVGRLGKGSYFGEIAHITTKPRQATVTAEGPLKCLVLKRKTFRRVMGPLQDILMRKMEDYNFESSKN